MARPKGSGVTPATDRFWMKVQPGLPYDECWPWLGARTPRGYGRFYLSEGKWTGAHRFSYQEIRASIPDGLVLDHLCMNPPCVNPWHLEPVTNEENMRRWSMSVTACPAGHPYDTPNTYRRKSDGSRHCRTCGAEAARQRRARIAAQRLPDGQQPAGVPTAETFLGVGA